MPLYCLKLLFRRKEEN